MAEENLNQPGAGQNNTNLQAGSVNNGDLDVFDESDDSKIPENLKPYIQKLRKENAQRRQQAKTLEERLAKNDETLGILKKHLGIEEDETDPKELLAQRELQLQAMEIQSEVDRAAYQLGIQEEDKPYFDYLLGMRLSHLEEGDGLTEEDVAEIANQVKQVANARANFTTGVKGKSQNPATGAQLTVEDFGKMTITERSKLYTEDPETYKVLFKAAKMKRLV